MIVKTEDVVCELCGLYDPTDFVNTLDYSYGTCENNFSYVFCSCSHVYLRNRPRLEELPKIYPSQYDAYNSVRRGFVGRIRRKKSLQHLKIIKRYSRNSKTLIDFGCASGEWLVHVADSSQWSGGLLGSDFHQRTPIALDGSAIQYLSVSDLGSLPDHSVSAVRMIQVIEHLSELDAQLSVLAHVLSDDGCLLIETPTPTGWDYRLGKGGLWGGWHAPRHFHVFQRSTLDTLIRRSGFEIVEFKYIFGPYVWLETLRAVLVRRGVEGRVLRAISLSNLLALAVVAFLDGVQLMLTRRTSNMRIVAKKRKF